jgi:hypothetical protein
MQWLSTATGSSPFSAVSAQLAAGRRVHIKAIAAHILPIRRRRYDSIG